MCTDTEMFGEKGTLSRMFESTHPARGMVFRELMTRQWISMSSAAIRKTALDSLGEWFDESLNVCEEADVFYRIAKTWELDHVDEALTRWRVHGVNTTFRKFGRVADQLCASSTSTAASIRADDAEYPDLAVLLTRRAAFQKAVALCGREGERSLCLSGTLCGFAQGAPFPAGFASARKPLHPLSQLYFKLPGFLRR